MNINKKKFFNFLTGLYQRNKIVILIATAIFLVFLFIGISISYFYSGSTGNLLNAYANALHSVIIEKTTLSIFTHNLKAALYTYLGGVIGIIPAGSLSFNGFFIGAFIGYLTHHSIVSTLGVFSTREFLIYTLPHGIFEIPGFILAGAAGFRLTTLIAGLINSLRNKTHASEHYWKLKDSLALLVISIILILIAAFIEANITPSLGNYLTGLNIT